MAVQAHRELGGRGDEADGGILGQVHHTQARGLAVPGLVTTTFSFKPQLPKYLLFHCGKNPRAHPHRDQHPSLQIKKQRVGKGLA